MNKILISLVFFILFVGMVTADTYISGVYVDEYEKDGKTTLIIRNDWNGTTYVIRYDTPVEKQEENKLDSIVTYVCLGIFAVVIIAIIIALAVTGRPSYDDDDFDNFLEDDDWDDEDDCVGVEPFEDDIPYDPEEIT